MRWCSLAQLELVIAIHFLGKFLAVFFTEL